MKWKKHIEGDVHAHFELKVYVTKEDFKTAITQLTFVYGRYVEELTAEEILQHIRDACSLHGENYFEEIAKEVYSAMATDQQRAEFKFQAEELFNELFGEAYNKEKDKA